MEVDIDGFGDRVKELIGSESVQSFAQKCGIPGSSLRNYLNGRVPGIDIAAKIANATGSPLEWLISGHDGPDRGYDFVVKATDGRVAVIQEKVSTPRGFALIPRLDIQASAGSGSLALSEEPLEYLAFQADWLRGRGINPEAARILTARGDSMEETIRDGDVLLVDTSIDRIRDNSIYIVVLGDMVLVKRIHGRTNGTVLLISDNSRYPTEEVTRGEAEQLHIAGRVMWFGRSI